MKARLYAALAFFYIFSVSVIVLGGAYFIVSACVTDKYSNASLIYQYYLTQESRDTDKQAPVIETVNYPPFNSFLSKL
jgi:hypothetical protein